MDYIIRDKSILTGKVNLEPLYTYKNFPVFFGCVESDPKTDLRADMSWAIDPETGVIQLDKLIPLEILYQAQHFDGTGSTWAKYNQDLVDYIALQKPRNILEIGGGVGNLADLYVKQTEGTTWSIVEPNPLRESSERVKIIPAFFDEKFEYAGEVDAIVFSQLMEHVYNPRAFIQAIAGYLKPGGKFIFAYPNLKWLLERHYTNALNFEHTMFLTDYFVDYLLVEYGFKIVDKSDYMGGKDHFYTAVRLEKPEKPAALENKYKEYKAIFMDFVHYHEELIKDLNNKLQGFEGEVYLFGAHIFSQYLLEFGLKTDKIVGILDNSKLKQGKRLYGYAFPVSSPEVLAGKGKVAVIVKVAHFREEIVKQLQEINPEALILE